jgi:hypothetical protein
MPDLNELWDWLAYVRDSNAFLIALPSFVALFLACIADWAERYLDPSRERAPTSVPDATSMQDRWQGSPRQFSGRP